MRLALIIPVKNEEATIAKLLTSIKSQTLEPTEVIIVDGGSTDNTIEATSKLIASDNRFSLLETGNAMPGKGRNIGADKTNCEWIAFTDAGIKLEPNWLENLAKKIDQDAQVDLVYGNFSPELNSFFEKCASITYVPALQPGKIRTKSVASCLIKKSLWKNSGGFPDWRAAEDLIFMEKVEQLNPVIATAPDAMVYWQLRPNLGGTFRRFDLYSRFNVWAGRQAYWHYGLARQYLIVPLAILAAIFHSPYWLLLLPVWMAGRVFKRVWQHRHEFGNSILFNPFIFLTVMIILLVIDAATFSGWLKAIFSKPPSLARTGQVKTVS